MEKKKLLPIFTDGIIKENPVLVLLLGTCPTLAVTTSAFNGIGMGVSTTFVLLGSNIVISALRKFIPDRVRIPAFITVIAGFVTVVQLFVKAVMPALDSILGIYLPLIVVNCILLGRAEAFAKDNGVVESALDGMGMGVGFTLVLFVMGAVRELLGSGTILGFVVTANVISPMTLMLLPPGGFFVYGIMVMVINKIKANERISRGFECDACPVAEACTIAPHENVKETEACKTQLEEGKKDEVNS